MHKLVSKLLMALTVLVTVYVVGNFLYLFDPRGPWTNHWCNRQILDEAISPEGSLKAQIVRISCNFGAANWIGVAIVGLGKTPSQNDEILSADMSEVPIELRWQAADRLEIAVPYNVYISKHKPEHGGVKIDLIRGRLP